RIGSFRSSCYRVDNDSRTDRSRCSATVAALTDRDVADRGSAAGSATGSDDVVVRVGADAGIRGFAGAAIRRDKVTRVVPVPDASYYCYCCCGCDPSRCYVGLAAVANRPTAADGASCPAAVGVAVRADAAVAVRIHGWLAVVAVAASADRVA